MSFINFVDKRLLSFLAQMSLFLRQTLIMSSNADFPDFSKVKSWESLALIILQDSVSFFNKYLKMLKSF